MLRYHDGRFYAGPVSFLLPDGLYLDSEPEILYPNSVNFCAPDGSFRLELMVEEDCADSRTEAESLLNSISPERHIGAITPITRNNLHGHQASYTSQGKICYEVRFDFEEDGTHKLFLYALIATPPLEPALQHPSCAAVLDSVRLEG